MLHVLQCAIRSLGLEKINSVLQVLHVLQVYLGFRCDTLVENASKYTLLYKQVVLCVLQCATDTLWQEKYIHVLQVLHVLQVCQGFGCDTHTVCTSR